VGAVPGGDSVEVTIPARPEFVSVARLAAATVAARQGFTYDEIEDVKLAVGEACASLIVSGTDQGHPMKIQFLLVPEALEIRVEAKGPGVILPLPAARRGPASEGLPIDESRMGIFLMQCVVDECVALHDETSGIAELRLVKRRRG
jgi:serine/threonine-protein kinase RsbW